MHLCNTQHAVRPSMPLRKRLTGWLLPGKGLPSNGVNHKVCTNLYNKKIIINNIRNDSKFY